MHPSIETLMRMPFENGTTIGVVIAFIIVGLTYYITLKCKKRKMIGKPTNLKLSNVECESVILMQMDKAKERKQVY